MKADKEPAKLSDLPLVVRLIGFSGNPTRLHVEAAQRISELEAVTACLLDHYLSCYGMLAARDALAAEAERLVPNWRTLMEEWKPPAVAASALTQKIKKIERYRMDGTRSAVLMEITPKMAAAWLGTKARRIYPSQVNRLAKYMTDGTWELVENPIKFDENGNLLDGQHRLKACVQSGKNFASYVAHNVATYP